MSTSIETKNCNSAEQFPRSAGGLEYVRVLGDGSTGASRANIVWLGYDIHLPDQDYQAPENPDTARTNNILASFSKRSLVSGQDFELVHACHLKAETTFTPTCYCKRFNHLAQRWLSPAAVLVKTASTGEIESYLSSSYPGQAVWGVITSRKRTMLHVATLWDRKPVIDCLLQLCSESKRFDYLTAKNIYQSTALHIAIKFAFVDCVRALLGYCPAGRQYEFVVGRTYGDGPSFDLAARFGSNQILDVLNQFCLGCDDLMREFGKFNNSLWVLRPSPFCSSLFNHDPWCCRVVSGSRGEKNTVYVTLSLKILLV